MLKALKTITSISVWVLFIHGLVVLAWGGVDMLIFTGGWKLTPMVAISCSVGTAKVRLAAVVARLRQMME